MKKISHLDDKKIIEAVMDYTALDTDQRRHLLECSVCRSQKEALEGGLARFGQISRDEVPIVFRKPGVFKLNTRGQMWRIRLVFGAGLAFAILVLLLSPLELNRDRLYNQDVVYREMLQDEKFMTEIEKLEENSLPITYVDIGDPSDDEKDIQSPGNAHYDGLTS